MLSPDQLQRDATTFLTQIFDRLKAASVEVYNWPIDHLCYRVQSQEQYQSMRVEFNQMGTLLIESMIGGRLISTYKLHTPITYGARQIPLIELPEPKASKPTLLGLEHAEFVCPLSFTELLERNPGLDWKTQGTKKTFNPELELRLGELAVKFHQMSLERVIEIEKSTSS